MDNGKPAKSPAIVIFYDETTQTTSVSCNEQVIRNPYFAPAVLDMAKAAVEKQLRLLALAEHQANAARSIQPAQQILRGG